MDGYIDEDMDDDVMEFDMEEDFLDDGYDEDDDHEDTAEMLEMLVDQFGEEAEDDDLSERKRRPRRRSRSRRFFRRRPRIRTASRGKAYKRPVSRKFVTHAQLKKVADVQDRKIARNGSGIKTVNRRISGVKRGLSGVVAVNAAQTKHLRTIRKKMRIDSALEFAAAYDGQQVDIFQLYKGAMKSDMIDTSKGTFANPFIVGGLGVLLKNPSLLGSVVQPQG